MSECKDLEKQAKKRLGRFSKDSRKAAFFYEGAGDCYIKEKESKKALECYYNAVHIFSTILHKSSSPKVVFEELEDIVTKSFKVKALNNDEIVKKIVDNYISALQNIRNYHRDNEEQLEEAISLEKLGDLLLRKKEDITTAKSYYAEAAETLLVLRGKYVKSQMSPVRIVELGIKARDLFEKAGKNIEYLDRRQRKELEYILETTRQLILKKKIERVNKLLELMLKHNCYPQPWTALHKRMMELLEIIGREEGINSLLISSLRQKIDTSEDERISAEIIRFIASQKDEMKERDIIEQLTQTSIVPNLTFERISNLISYLAQKGYFKIEKTSTGRLIRVKSVQEDAIKVLELVKDSGEISIPELSQQTGWRPSRSKDVLEQFVDQGIARKVPSYDEGDIYYFPHYWRPIS